MQEKKVVMTLHEAFAKLIMVRCWYKNSGYLKEQALRDKRYFLMGKQLPEPRLRNYLKAAGWEQVQQEEWAKKAESSSLHELTDNATDGRED